MLKRNWLFCLHLKRILFVITLLFGMLLGNFLCPIHSAYAESVALDSGEKVISANTSCHEPLKDLQFGIFNKGFLPVLWANKATAEMKKNGVISEKEYRDAMLIVATGLLDFQKGLGVKGGAKEVAMDIVQDGLRSYGEGTASEYTNETLIGGLSEAYDGIAVLSNPTPFEVAKHLTSKTFSIANNLFATWSLSTANREFVMESSIERVLTRMYSGCGTDGLSEKLGITDPFNGCSGTLVPCMVKAFMEQKYGEKDGWFYSIDMDYINHTVNSTTVNLFYHISHAIKGAGVFCHAQVIEDQPGATV
ncbi:MAG: hypothetical protein HZA01_00960 [Nitrospinae bacterium]|nr:hypothetical protein [Nitrospinota bacterium]